ncbi:MAG: cytochrome c [Verrucomicrobiales bacterium]|nr:cytochrome c [Verrucomicrobiales bacterium]
MKNFLYALCFVFAAGCFSTNGLCEDKKKREPLFVLAKGKKVDFVKEIKPIFEEHCMRCHHSKSQFTLLKLHTREQILAATTKDRPILIPGNARNNSLYLVTALPNYFVEAMPAQGHKLSDEEKDKIYRWINQGAKWPDNVILDVDPRVEIIKEGSL